VARPGAAVPGGGGPVHRPHVAVLSVGEDQVVLGLLSVSSRRSVVILRSYAVPLRVSSSVVYAARSRRGQPPRSCGHRPIARGLHERCSLKPRALNPIRLCCNAFRGGAGDGNRTRTVSLRTVSTHGACAWIFGGSWSRAAWSVPWMPAVMARSRRFESTGQNESPSPRRLRCEPSLRGRWGLAGEARPDGARVLARKQGDRIDPQTLSREPCDLDTQLRTYVLGREAPGCGGGVGSLVEASHFQGTGTRDPSQRDRPSR
jgi:hypothetical protein